MLRLTARYTNQAEVIALSYKLKVIAGSSDRVRIFMCMHHRIKGTLGITGLSLKRVHIDLELGYIDVVLSHPYAEEGIKG